MTQTQKPIFLIKQSAQYIQVQWDARTGTTSIWFDGSTTRGWTPCFESREKAENYRAKYLSAFEPLTVVEEAL